MKMRLPVYLGAVPVLALSLGLEAIAGPEIGNCTTKADPISFSASETTGNVTLKRRWYEGMGGCWYDGGDDSTPVSQQQGAYFVTATLAYQQAYVMWLTDTGSANMYVTQTTPYQDWSGGTPPPMISTWFSSYSCGNLKYIYLDANKWSAREKSGAQFHFQIGGTRESGAEIVPCRPGETCTLHWRKCSLADILPAGTDKKPYQLGTLTQPGTRSDPTPGDSGRFYYSATLKGGKRYKFTATPTVPGQPSSIRLSTSASSALYTITTSTDEQGVTVSTVQASQDISVDFLVSSGLKSNFAWGIDDGGLVGFESTAVTADGDSGFAVLTVVRSGNTGQAVKVEWGTVSDTAVAGVDYEPVHGYLEWPAGSAGSKNVTIKLIPPVADPDNSRQFSVRLEAVDIGSPELPVVVPKVATVNPVYKARVKPEPVVPPAQDEEPGTPLAVGTFTGVLRGGTGDVSTNGVYALSRVVVRAAKDGAMSAVVSVAEHDYEFSGSDGLLTRSQTIGGKTCVSRMSVQLPEGTVELLAGGSPVAQVEDLSLYVDLGGEAVELGYRGTLYREESRLATPVLARMKKVAGTYAYALEGSRSLWNPGGCGCLSLNIGVGGEVVVTGILGDGTDVSFSAVAYEEEDSVSVPLLWTDGLTTFGGTLMLSGAGNLVWRDDRAQFGGDGESGFAIELTANGGRYDPLRNFSSLFSGYALLVDDAASGFDGLTLTPTKNGFTSDDPDVTLAFDPATGLLSGEGGGRSFRAVLLPGTAGFLGCEFDGVALSSRFAIEAVWQDKWSEHWGWTSQITFDIGPASGIAPLARRAEIGGTVLLPESSRSTFYRDGGYILSGWVAENTGRFYAPGTIPTPATDTKFVAEWEVGGLEEYLTGPGLDQLRFSYGGDVPWRPLEVSGVKLMQSGDVEDGNSVLKAVTRSAGTLTFTWQCRDDDWNESRCTFTVNGVPVRTIRDSGDRIETLDVDAGAELTWMYEMESSGGDDDLCYAQLRNLSFGRKTEVTFLAEGGVPERTVVAGLAGARLGECVAALPKPTWDDRTFVSWTTPTGGTVTLDWVIPEEDVTLTAVTVDRRYFITYDLNGGSGTRPEDDEFGHGTNDLVKLADGSGLSKSGGYAFRGWRIDGKVYDPEKGDLYRMPARDVTASVNWVLSLDDYLTGPGLENLDFSYGGKVPWRPLEVSGVKLMQSGKVEDGNSVLKAVTRSAGTLTFTWQCRDDDWNESRCTFAVNGVPVRTIRDSGDRVETLDVDAGAELTWMYEMEFSAGDDDLCYAQLRNLSFGQKTEVTFLAEGGVPERMVVAGLAGARLGECVAALPKPTWDDRTFVSWTTPTGGTVTLDWVIPEEDVTLTAVTVDRRYFITYDLNGGSGTRPEDDEFGHGTNDLVKLADGSGLSKSGGYAFRGWRIDGKVYDPEKGDLYRMPARDVTALANWGLNLDDYLTGPGLENLDFSYGGKVPWRPLEVSGVKLMQSGRVEDGNSVLKAVTHSAGTLTFTWQCRDDDFNESSCTFAVNGVLVRTIRDSGDRIETLDVDAGAELTWTYEMESFGGDDDPCYARLRNLSFKSAVPVDFKDVKLPLAAGTTPASLGITSGSFANSDLDELNRLVAWAKENDMTVAAVNAMRFDPSGIPTDLATEAYLLNCAPESGSVEIAKAGFRFISFVVGEIPTIEGNYNGRVRILQATSLDGPWSDATAGGGGERMFYKALLVR